MLSSVFLLLSNAHNHQVMICSRSEQRQRKASTIIMLPRSNGCKSVVELLMCGIESINHNKKMIFSLD